MPQAPREILGRPARLAALRRAALLDTPAEAAFDRLTRLAATILGAPVALVTLVDADRQFFKSAVGLPEPWASRREMPLSHSFCQHAVASGAPLVIADARDHPLVRDNLAIPELGVVAYAGIPLITADGAVLGSFCVIDQRPRDWTLEEIAILTDLAAVVLTEIELRVAAREAQDRAAEAERERREKLALLHREEAARAEAEAARAEVVATLERITEGFFALDREWRFTYVNRRAELLLCRPAAELLGRSIWEVFPEGAGSPFARQYQQAVTTGRAVAFEAYSPALATWLEVHAYPGHDGLSVFFRDTGLRRRAEAALRASEAQFRDVYAAVGQVTMALDGRFLSVNRAFCDFTGYSEAELLARSFHDLIPPDELPVATGDVRRLLSGELPHYQRERRYRRKDGAIVTGLIGTSAIRDDAGRPRYLLGLLQDITARKEAEAALRASDERLRVVVTSAPVILFALDRDGVFTLAEGRGLAGLGGRPGQVVGESIFDLYRDHPRLLDNIHRALAGEEFAATVEVGELVFETSYVPLRDERGAVTGVTGLATDVTARVRAEEELRRQNAYLAALHETTLAIVDRLDPAELLEAIVRRAGALLGTPHGYIHLVEPDGSALLTWVGTGAFGDHLGQRIAPGEGLAGRVWQTGRALVVDEYRSWPGRRTAIDADPFHAVVGVPLTSRGKVVGVTGLAYLEPERHFGEAELAALSRFAELASLALDNARLYTAAQQELAERKALEARLARQAFHDFLTGLPNRALFRARLDNALRATGGPRDPVVVLFVDLDGFKEINDRFGHEAGDRALQIVAGRLERCVRAGDTVARLGGDEFTVLLPAATEADAVRVATSILQVLQRPLGVDGGEATISASVGIALGTPGRDTSEDLLRRADRAQYRAKASGKADYAVAE